MDTDTRDDDAPTGGAYPLRPAWLDIEPDTDGLDCDGEDCDRAYVDLLGWWRPGFGDAGLDCADGLEKPPCRERCGSEPHKPHDCNDVPF